MRLAKTFFPSLRSVFARFVIHYLVLLLVLSCVGAYLYNRSVHYAEREAMESGLAKLDKSKELLDTRMKEVESLVTQLSLDPRLRHLLSLKKPYTGDDIFRIKEIADSLASYKYSNLFIRDVFLYLNNDTLISSTQPTTNASMLYGKLFGYEGLGYEDWRERLLGAYHYSDYWPISRVRLGVDNPEAMTYVQSAPIGAVHTYKGVLGVLIDGDEVRKMLATVVDGGEAWSYVEDANGHILAEWNRPGDMEGSLELPEGARGNFIRRWEGAKTLVMYSVSARTGWTYVAAVPYASVIRNVAYIKTMYQTTMAIAVALGLLIAVALSYSSSRPIWQIIRKLKQGVGGTAAGAKSEYDFLAGTISQLLANRERMEADLTQQQQLVRATFLERLLRGGFSKEREIESVRSYIGFDLPEGEFVAAMVALDPGGETDVSPDLLERYDTAKVLVRRLFEEKLSYPMKDYSMDSATLVFLLGTNGAERERLRVELSETAALTAELLRGSCAMAIRVGIGSPSAGLIHIRNSFEEAGQALETLREKPPGSVAFFADLERQKDDYYYPLDSETRLINLVKAGDELEACLVLGQLHERNRALEGAGGAAVEQLAFELRGTAVKLRKSIDAAWPRESERPDWPIDGLRGDLAVDELFERSEAVFRAMCRWIAGQKNDRQKTLADRMLRLIEAHYREDDWSLYKFASELGMTEKYASQLFKELTGIGFSQALETRRMADAARLLQDTDVSVNDIARLTGYANPNTFYKAFKRCYGVSPTVYRQNLLGGS